MEFEKALPSRYSDSKPIAEGVCRCYDRRTKRECVVKAFPDAFRDLASYRDFSGLCHLVHPNVVRMERVECDTVGNAYLVMEDVGGAGTVQTWLFKDGRDFVPGLDEKRLGILREVADALDYVHACGLLHRNVKSTNVLMTKDGHAKLTGFDLGNGSAPQGRASDQLSFAVMAYELISGTLPFAADSQAPGEIPQVTSLSDAENVVLRKALSKDPKGRYGSCTEFVDALAAAHDAAEAVHAKPKRRSSLAALLSWKVIVPTLLLAALVAVGIYGWVRHRNEVRDRAWDSCDTATKWQMRAKDFLAETFAQASWTSATNKMALAKSKYERKNYIEAEELFAKAAEEFKKSAKEAGRALENERRKKEKCGLNDFFPVSGVTLGRTRHSEIAAMGGKAEGGYADKCVYYGDWAWWDHDKNGVVEDVYMLHYNKLPKEWIRKGMSWEMSYDDWTAFFQDKGFSIKVKQTPTTKPHSQDANIKTLEAEFEATSFDGSVRFNLDFNFGNQHGEGYSTSSRNSLYSITVHAVVARSLTLPGGMTMEMVYCAPGDYVYGYANTPLKMDHAFWLGKYEVTQKQWKSVMNGVVAKDGKEISDPSRWKGDDLPVENVSWDDCQEFVKRVSEAAREQFGGEARLPNEHEWEYACRAGTRSNYSWGDVLNGNQANCDGNYPNGTETKGPYLKKTTPVGSYEAKGKNNWGFCDMHGNVKEWCEDKDDSGTNRVTRGGCWDNIAGVCRSAYRDRSYPCGRSSYHGFRLCCSAGPREKAEPLGSSDGNAAQSERAASDSGAILSEGLVTPELVLSDLGEETQNYNVSAQLVVARKVHDDEMAIRAKSLSEEYFQTNKLGPAVSRVDVGEISSTILSEAEEAQKRREAEEALSAAKPLPAPAMARVDEAVIEQEKAAVRKLRDEKTSAGQSFDKNVDVDLGYWIDPKTPSRKYFRVRVASNPDNPLPVVSKDIVFLLDASGSIRNDRLKSCCHAVQEAFDRLNTGDRFNVIAFRDKFSYAFPETAWREVDKDSVEQASKWMSTLKAHGSTDVFRTLRGVLTLPRDPARPIVAFVATDGDATSGTTNSAEIISRFSELNGGLVSIFMYGVKPESNAYLMDMLTRGNRGGWVCHKGHGPFVAQGVPELSKKFERPVLTDVAVIFAASSRAETYPKFVTNLCEDEPIEIYGVCPADQKELVFQMRGLNAVTAYESIYKLPFSSAKLLGRELRAAASDYVSQASSGERLAFAIQLSKRSMHAEALYEYEAIRNAKGVPHDEVLFRLGDTYRTLNRTDDALNCYAELIASEPASRYVDVARLNRAMLRTGEVRARMLEELTRDSAPPAIRAMAFNYLGDIAKGEKNVGAAVEYYARAAKISPSNEVGRAANLKCAALLSESSVRTDHVEALTIYLEMANSDNAKLAEEALFSVAMLGYHEGMYQLAANRFRELAEKYPSSPRVGESRIYAAWACYLSKSYKEALAIASPLRGPGNEDAYYITASSLRMLERDADAIHAYAAQLQAFPKGRYFDDAWFDYLTIVAAKGDNVGVLAMLGDWPNPPAKYAECAWGLGCESAIALTNYPVAMRYAKRVAEKNGDTAPSAVHRLAWLLEQTRDWAKAARAYRGLAGNWPTNGLAPQALFLAGSCEMKRGQTDLACNDWKNLVTRYPDSPYASDALYARAMALLMRPEKTVQDYRAVEQLLGERLARFPKASRRMESLYWLGVATHGSGDDPEAEKHLRAALAERPSAAYERAIKLELASVLKKRGKALEAAELFVSLMDTKVVDRLQPELLEWTARTLMDERRWNAARTAAEVLERRQVDPAWTQTAATLVGRAHEQLGERDAAKEAYARALATGAETESGAQAALALGRLESNDGLFDEACAHLENAVMRAQAQDLLPLRIQAYAALAENEEERGVMDKALGYYMLVSSLYDDARMVPHALSRASAILKNMGRGKESADVLAELRRRFPDAPEAKEDTD